MHIEDALRVVLNQEDDVKARSCRTGAAAIAGLIVKDRAAISDGNKHTSGISSAASSVINRLKLQRASMRKRGARKRTTEDGVKVDKCFDVGHECVASCPAEAKAMKRVLSKANLKVVKSQPSFVSPSYGYVAVCDLLCTDPVYDAVLVECKVGHSSEIALLTAKMQCALQSIAMRDAASSAKAPRGLVLRVTSPTSRAVLHEVTDRDVVEAEMFLKTPKGI